MKPNMTTIKSTINYDRLNDLPLQVLVILFKQTEIPGHKRVTYKTVYRPRQQVIHDLQTDNPFFKAGTAEWPFTFLCNIEKVTAGQDANDLSSKYALMCRLL